jgi:predicted nucleotidyltransferase
MQIESDKIIALGEKFELNYLSLFGSRALGNFRDSSDYDIAYSSKKEIDAGEEFFLTEDIARALQIPIKLIDITNTKNAGPLLMHEISKGRLIKEFAPNSFDHFQIYAFMIYIESKPLFKMKEEYVKRLIEK